MKMKALILSILCLLVILVSVPSSAADPEPRFFVIGEGNFEVFDLEDGSSVAMQVPYESGPFQRREGSGYFLVKSKDAYGNLNISKSESEMTRHTIQPGMVDPKALSDPKVALDLKENLKDAEWTTVLSNGRDYVLSTHRERLSPNKRKFIISEFERELWIYNSETDRIEVSRVNIGRGKDFVRGGIPIDWFCHPSWARDGRRIAYYSNKDAEDYYNGVWILDDTGKERCVIKSKGHSFALLGWAYDNRLILERENEIGICDLKGNFRSIAKKVVGLSDGTLSPDGRRLIVAKAGSIYGQAIIDFVTGSLLEIPQLAGYQDNCTFAWSKNGKKVAFYLYNRELDDARKPYTTGAKLAVAEVLPNGKIGFRTYDSPCPGSWFFIAGALSWFGDDVVVASLTNETTIGLEVR